MISLPIKITLKKTYFDALQCLSLITVSKVSNSLNLNVTLSLPLSLSLSYSDLTLQTLYFHFTHAYVREFNERDFFFLLSWGVTRVLKLRGLFLIFLGYNGTIFAYGQTGAGKTYTIQGPSCSLRQSIPEEELGIMPRVFSYIFG